MADVIQIRRDTAANWTASNPVLHQGEQGLETDSGKQKMGDGVTAWNSLEYSSSGFYKEGSFFPALTIGGSSTGITYYNKIGKYIRIGKQVIITGMISINSTGGLTGDLLITGLPYTIVSYPEYLAPAAIVVRGVSYTGSLTAYINQNTSILTLAYTTEAGTETTLKNTNIGGGSQIHFSVSYITP